MSIEWSAYTSQLHLTWEEVYQEFEKRRRKEFQQHQAKRDQAEEELHNRIINDMSYDL